MGKRGSGTDQSHRVLIIDDEPELAALVGDFLEHLDAGLQTAHEPDPRAGLRRFDDERFDCAVVDYDMAPIDGLAVIDAMPDDVPAVLFTHHRDTSLAECARARGAAYLPKRTDHRQYDRLATLIRDQVGD